MTDTALALTASRTAHKQKNFQVALDERMRARDLDPDRQDPAWLDDALAPPRQGIQGKQYHRIPGKTLPEVAAVHDVELELFYRQRLGEQPNPVMEVSSQLETRVLVPDHWVLQQSGVVNCQTCGHPHDDHEQGGVCEHGECECEAFLPLGCIHAFETTGAKSRRCVGCGQVDHLVPKMAVEETLAYQQAMQERTAKG